MTHPDYAAIAREMDVTVNTFSHYTPAQRWYILESILRKHFEPVVEWFRASEANAKLVTLENHQLTAERHQLRAKLERAKAVLQDIAGETMRVQYDTGFDSPYIPTASARKAQAVLKET